MTQLFEPFTPELFKQQTGLDAMDNEAIYIRWVNSQINCHSLLQKDFFPGCTSCGSAFVRPFVQSGRSIE